MDQFTGRSVLDVDTINDSIISEGSTSSSEVFEHYMEQREALHAVIRCWRGQQKSILPILKFVELLEDEFPSTLLKMSLGSTPLLLDLHTSFQDTGESIIAFWKETRLWADLCSRETDTSFAPEVWHMAPVNAKHRLNPDSTQK